MKRAFALAFLVALLALAGCAATQTTEMRVPGAKPVKVTTILPPLSSNALPLTPFGGQREIAGLGVVLSADFVAENFVKINGETVGASVYPAILVLDGRGVGAWISMKPRSLLQGDVLIPGVSASDIPGSAKVYVFGKRQMIEVSGNHPQNFSPRDKQGWEEFQRLLQERFRRDNVANDWIVTTLSADQFRAQLVKTSAWRKAGEALPPIGPLTLLLPVYREFYLANLVLNQAVSASGAFDPDREDPTPKEIWQALIRKPVSPNEMQQLLEALKRLEGKQGHE